MLLLQQLLFLLAGNIQLLQNPQLVQKHLGLPGVRVEDIAITLRHFSSPSCSFWGHMPVCTPTPQSHHGYVFDSAYR